MAQGQSIDHMENRRYRRYGKTSWNVVITFVITTTFACQTFSLCHLASLTQNLIYGHLCRINLTSVAPLEIHLLRRMSTLLIHSIVRALTRRFLSEPQDGTTALQVFGPPCWLSEDGAPAASTASQRVSPLLSQVAVALMHTCCGALSPWSLFSVSWLLDGLQPGCCSSSSAGSGSTSHTSTPSWLVAAV